jgi:hypothetical protein
MASAMRPAPTKPTRCQKGPSAAIALRAGLQAPCQGRGPRPLAVHWHEEALISSPPIGGDEWWAWLRDTESPASPGPGAP